MFRYIGSFRYKDGLHSYQEWQNFAAVKTHPYIQIISSIKKKKKILIWLRERFKASVDP